MYFKIIFLLLTGCAIVHCNNLMVGEANNGKLLYHTVAQYQPISWARRTKYIVFASPDLAVIRGINVQDKLNSNATANILVGGIGYSFVTIKLKSEKGKPLDYVIEIFA